MFGLRPAKKETADSLRRRRMAAPAAKSVPYGWLRTAATILVFGGFTAALVLICFIGLNPVSPLLVEGKISRVRVLAEIPFSYESRIETEALKAERRRLLPAVFRIDLEAGNAFIQRLSLATESVAAQMQGSGTDPEAAASVISILQTDRILREMAGDPKAPPISGSDLTQLANIIGPVRLREVVREGSVLLADLSRQGIYSPEDHGIAEADDSVRYFNIVDAANRIEQVKVLTEDEALRSLRINLAALDIPREASAALFRLLRQGVDPNLKYDEVRSQELVESSLRDVAPVRNLVRAGDTLIEPNARVTALQAERLEAYRTALRENEQAELGFRTWLVERILIAVLIMVGASLYLRISRTSLRENRRTLVLSGVLILFNLLLIRLLFEMGDSTFAQSNPTFVALLPTLLPVALGPMILTILVGPGPGLLAAGLIAVLSGMMQGSNSVPVVIVIIVINLVAIQLCRNTQVRSKVVRAGFVSGAVAAILSLLGGMRSEQEFLIALYGVVAAIGTGLVTGVVVVGLLPIWEWIFRYTTNITLLELTDFNHPLLRRMQVEAPGSYHHSLMVANLSENAAAAIGADPLVCRACSYFHDIGKLLKAEYYTENQRDGYNPHIERNPSMSALVIKSHVKEGVILAKQHKLPKVVIDVIQQHHGTSLIQYFYYKAIERQKSEAEAANPGNPNAPRIELDPVNEDTYRYEGPKPRFVESAIIMLADSVEAAGRSLRKVTPQSIDELIDKIVTSRMQDGQLDETPLTLGQLAKIRESFSFTLLNMLHARVEYPEDDPNRRAQKKVSRRGSTSPFAEAAARVAAQAGAETVKAERAAGTQAPMPAKPASDLPAPASAAKPAVASEAPAKPATAGEAAAEAAKQPPPHAPKH